MRITKFIVFFIVISLSLSIALPAFAADGAATYKAQNRRRQPERNSDGS